MKKTLRYAAAGIVLLAAFVYLNNTTLLVFERPAGPILLAHRGLAQTFDLAGVKGDTCTATRIYPPEHPFLENTMRSMRAAFNAGADIVEFDIHPTTDGHFAVFHDWTWIAGPKATASRASRPSLPSRRSTSARLHRGWRQDLPIPRPRRRHDAVARRGARRFPARRFLIHIKSNDPAEGETLAERLRELPPSAAQLMVYGGDRRSPRAARFPTSRRCRARRSSDAYCATSPSAGSAACRPHAVAAFC